MLTGQEQGQETKPGRGRGAELSGRSDWMVPLHSVQTEEPIQRLEAYLESCSVSMNWSPTAST